MNSEVLEQGKSKGVCLPEAFLQAVEEQHGTGGAGHLGDLVVPAEGESDAAGGGGAAAEHRAGAVGLAEHRGLEAGRGRRHAAPLAPQPRRERQTPVDAAADTCERGGAR